MTKQLAMKKLVLSIGAIVALQFVYAQNPDSTANVDTAQTWKFFGLGSVNFSQAQLTNWSAGGENSISGTGLFNAHLHYKKKNLPGKMIWSWLMDSSSKGRIN